MNGIMDRQQSRLIGVIVVVGIVAIAAVLIIFLPSSDKGNVEYIKNDGKILVTESEPFSDGIWEADVTYFDSSSRHHTVIEDHPVEISENHLSAVIQDNALVNLDNYTYELRLMSGSDLKVYSFGVSDHEFSGSEMAVIIAVISILVICMVIAVVRRIVRGHW